MEIGKEIYKQAQTDENESNTKNKDNDEEIIEEP